MQVVLGLGSLDPLHDIASRLLRMVEGRAGVIVRTGLRVVRHPAGELPRQAVQPERTSIAGKDPCRLLSNHQAIGTSSNWDIKQLGIST